MRIGSGKNGGVLIGEYGSPDGKPEARSDGNDILGYIEPACDKPQWILWFTAKGDAILNRKRDYTKGHTGAVLDEPLRIKGSS
jgi:hypothetical protein